MRTEFSDLNTEPRPVPGNVYDTGDCADALCKIYNNIYGAPTGTRMERKDDKYYIKGKAVDRNGEFGDWASYMVRMRYGQPYGYYDVFDMCAKHNLYFYGEYDIMPGTYILNPADDDEELMGCCKLPCPNSNSYTTSESQIPRPLSELDVHGNGLRVKEYLQCENIGQACKKLNESMYMRPKNWTINDGHLIGFMGNKIIIL